MSNLIDASVNSTTVPRTILAQVFTNPQLLLAIEAVLKIASEVPDAVNTLGNAGLWLETGSPLLPNARQVIPGTGVTLDYSTAGHVTINVFVSIDATSRVSGLRNADDDAAAAALTPPVPLGGLYLNGSVLQVRLA